MQRYIDDLRERPKAVRAQAAFVVASVITGVLFFGWAYSLGDRIFIESADPTIVQYQRELQEEKRQNIDEGASGLGAVFSRMQRGVAGVIFNESPEETAPVVDDSKTIDIEALIAQPRAPRQAPPADQKVVPAGDDTVVPEQIILIGTTTNNAENVE